MDRAKRQERQESPKADWKMAEQQNAKLTKLTKQNGTGMVLPRTVLPKNSVQPSWKS